MPTIKSSVDFKNNYNEISALCHEYAEPVFITKNGIGDVVVMSIETYESLSGRLQLYSFIEDGLNHVKAGRVKPMKESMRSMRTKIKQQCIS